MKKLLLISVLFLGFSVAHAQFGIQAGAVFYAGKASADNMSIKYDTKVGFTAGVVYSAPLSSNISFMPSLNYTQKGGKYSAEGIKDNLSLSYIELPLNFVYSTGENGNGFFAGAGPSLAYGVGGEDKATVLGEAQNSDVHFGSGDNDDLKPFEFGANIIAGYKWDNGLFVAANYNPSISDISNDESAKFHNSGFGIRIGFLFGGNTNSNQ